MISWECGTGSEGMAYLYLFLPPNYSSQGAVGLQAFQLTPKLLCSHDYCCHPSP